MNVWTVCSLTLKNWLKYCFQSILFSEDFYLKVPCLSISSILVNIDKMKSKFVFSFFNITIILKKNLCGETNFMALSLNSAYPVSRSTDFSLFCTIFSRMVVQKTDLKEKICFQSQQHICLQLWNIKIMSPAKMAEEVNAVYWLPWSY